MSAMKNIPAGLHEINPSYKTQYSEYYNHASKVNYFLIIIMFCPLLCLAQKEDRVWVFDDSICINFNNLINPTVTSIGTNMQADENYASIADSAGNLLYYVGGGHPLNGGAFRLTAIFGHNEDIIINGDSLESSRSITQGTLFIPSPSDSNLTYLFYIDYDYSTLAIQTVGLYYCILDKSQDSGNGSCIIKNNLLVHDTLTEKLTAVKHGNGRDWWVIAHKNNSKNFYKFLLTPQGISAPIIQSIGPKLLNVSQGQMKFSPDGTKLGLVSTDKHVSLFDFDRCTGLLSNYKNLGNSESYGCSFSPNSKLFYMSTLKGTGFAKDSLFQFDLNATNILQSKLLLWTDKDSFLIGQHLLAPDGQIYIATCYSLFQNNVYDSANMYLSVITKPDVVGTGCNFEPYSFYLNGLKCLGGLPNMINYNLGVLIASSCDTLNSATQNISSDLSNSIKIFPNPAADKLFISAHKKNYSITITDILGRKIFSSQQNSTEINISDFAKGIYFVKVKMIDGSITVRKFLKS